MIKVYQTIIDKGHGNCVQAAIASLFELRLEKVPHFLEYGEKWFEIFYNFVRKQGYDIEFLRNNIKFYEIKYLY